MDAAISSNPVSSNPIADAIDAALKNRDDRHHQFMPQLGSEQVVPDIPWLPASPQTPQQWFSWREKVIVHRLQMLLETSLPGPDGDAARVREVDRCRDSIAYFLCTYGTIYEARDDVAPEDMTEDELTSSFVPLILFPFQIRYVQWYEERMRGRGGGDTGGDGMAVKSRDMGLSNITIFCVAHNWGFKTPFQARLLSRTEDLVDDTGNPDSMFWKLENFLRTLPEWLFEAMAPGFDWKKNRNLAKLTNPRNKNAIIGESTQANAGRGGRATIIVYDEAAFMDNFGAIWTAGRDSTRHRIAISTVSIDKGMDFYNLHHGRKGYTRPAVIEFLYREHPYHDEQWLQDEILRDTPEGIAREIFMDYFAGMSEWVYPEAGKKQPGYFPYIPGGGHVYLVGDDGFDDDWAMVWIQYVNETGRLRVFQSYSNRHQIVDFYGSMIKGLPESRFHYGPIEQRIMRRQRELPPQTTVFDSHLDQVEQITGTSPAEHLAQKYGIAPFFNFDPKARSFKNRRLQLGNLLPIMDFHNADGAVEALEAVQRRRFKQSREGHDQQAEYKEPLHDKDSHLATALEWFAINWESVRYGATGEAMVFTGAPAT